MHRKAALIYKSASLRSLDKKLIFSCRKNNTKKRQVKQLEDQDEILLKRRCVWHEVALCWYRSRGLLNQNKWRLPAPRGREERRGSHPVLTAQGKGCFKHIHTDLSSVRLDPFGGNMTQSARLAQPITTQQLVGTETGRAPSCNMYR